MRANKPPLDDRDRAILRLLQADGRLTNLELAQRINLSPSSCLRRVKLLEESGLIARYVVHHPSRHPNLTTLGVGMQC